MRSIFSVITPAADAQLLSIEELRAAAGVTGGAQDVELTAMGAQLSEAIARECGVASDGVNSPTLMRETCRETFHSMAAIGLMHAPALRLARRPINEVDAISIDGSAFDLSLVLVDRPGGVLRRRAADWCGEDIIVEYSAGFGVVPAGLKLAAIKLMTALWAERSRDPSLRRDVVEGVGTQEFWVSATADPLLSAEINDLLSPYVERWF